MEVFFLRPRRRQYPTHIYIYIYIHKYIYTYIYIYIYIYICTDSKQTTQVDDEEANKDLQEGEMPKKKTIPITTQEWEVQNTQKPLWMRPPSKVCMCAPCYDSTSFTLWHWSCVCMHVLVIWDGILCFKCNKKDYAACTLWMCHPSKVCVQAYACSLKTCFRTWQRFGCCARLLLNLCHVLLNLCIICAICHKHLFQNLTKISMLCLSFSIEFMHE